MQAHGYGNRTFRFETNARGQPKVHRVNGQHPFSHYDNTLGTAVIAELEQAFDFTANIYFIVLGADALRQGNGQPAGGVANQVGKNGGHVVVPNRFGGEHWHMNSDTPSDWDTISAMIRISCRMAIVRVLLYRLVMLNFYPSTPTLTRGPRLRKYHRHLLNSFPLPAYLAGAKSIPVRLKVQDPNGFIKCNSLGQVDFRSVVDWQGKRSVIEFEYDGGIGLLDFDAGLVDITSLSDAVSHNILVNVVDRHGNVSKKLFRLSEDSPYHIATLKIEDFIDDEIFTLSGAIAFSPNGTLLATAIPQWIKEGRRAGVISSTIIIASTCGMSRRKKISPHLIWGIGQCPFYGVLT